MSRGPASRAAAEVVASCHLLAGEGLVAGFGHVSCRLDAASFVISGKVPLGTISADQVVVVGPDGVEEGDPALLPVEAAIHAAVYAARPEFGAIARTHGEFCSVLSLCGRAVRPVHAFGATLGPTVPVFDHCHLIESPAQAEAVVKVLGAAPAVLLRGNGAVVGGADPVDATVLAYYLEESARLQYRAGAGEEASTLRFLAPAEIEAAAANLGSRPQILRTWGALCDRHGLSVVRSP